MLQFCHRICVPGGTKASQQDKVKDDADSHNAGSLNYKRKLLLSQAHGMPPTPRQWPTSPAGQCIPPEPWPAYPLPPGVTSSCSKHSMHSPLSSDCSGTHTTWWDLPPQRQEPGVLSSDRETGTSSPGNTLLMPSQHTAMNWTVPDSLRQGL